MFLNAEWYDMQLYLDNLANKTICKYFYIDQAMYIYVQNYCFKQLTYFYTYLYEHTKHYFNLYIHITDKYETLFQFNDF